MSYSRSMAHRAAINLSGLALGMWEAARLLASPDTAEEGHQMTRSLRERLDTLTREPFLRDSLAIYVDKNVSLDMYTHILDKLEENTANELMSDIEALVENTEKYLDESRRTTTDFQSAY